MINNFINFIKKYSLPIYFIANIIYLLIMSILTFFDRTTFYILLGKSYILLSIVTFALCIFMYVKNKKYNIVDLLTLCLIIFAIISVVFSIDFESAVFGFRGRYEGFFAIFYYLCLSNLASYVDSKNKKIIVFAILILGFMHVLFAFGQVIGYFRLDNKVFKHIVGLAINSNFFGSLMVICLSYIIGLFIDSDDILVKIIYLFLMVIFIFGLFSSNTTSALVGLIVVLLLSFVFIIYKKKYLDLIIIFILILFIPFMLQKHGNTTLLKDLNKTGSEIVEISKGNIDDDFGTKRIKVWKETLKVVPKYLIHGVGIDNYYFAFGERPLTIGKFFYDKAHNEYLQILVTEGIFCLIFYLVFYFIICMDGLINCFKDNKIYLLLPVVGYLVQAFFNISVIEVAPIFYIALGLLVDRDKVYLNKKLKR